MRKPKDWGQPCPNPECFHYRRMRQGNVSAIATYLTQSGKRRIFRCHTCETPFSETRETVFFDLRTSEDKVMMALKMLLVRVDLAGIGFVLGVTEATVLGWLRRAAHQADTINRHLLRALPVTQVSSASIRVRRTRWVKAGLTARMDGNGSGSALLPSFG
jgi:transposase-like protein